MLAEAMGVSRAGREVPAVLLGCSAASPTPTVPPPPPIPRPTAARYRPLTPTELTNQAIALIFQRSHWFSNDFHWFPLIFIDFGVMLWSIGLSVWLTWMCGRSGGTARHCLVMPTGSMTTMSTADISRHARDDPNASTSIKSPPVLDCRKTTPFIYGFVY